MEPSSPAHLPVPPEPPEEDPTPPARRLSPFLGLCLATAAVSVLYRLLVLGHLEQTSLMFIGLPTILAVLLALTPPAKTSTGMIMKGISLFLALLGILFIEGFICILMAAPLCYAIGFIIGIFADRARVRKDMDRFRLLVLPTLALMSLEGVTGSLSFPRDESIVIEHHTTLTVAEVRAHLANGPDFDPDRLPAFLKLGFPTPHSIRGDGLAEGDRWRIHFAGGEGEPGDLEVKVVANTGKHLRFVCINDTSHIAHWLDWQQVDWHLEPTPTGTRITLQLRYRRLLDPAWYFKPIERHGVRKAGEYFISQTFPES